MKIGLMIVEIDSGTQKLKKRFSYYFIMKCLAGLVYGRNIKLDNNSVLKLRNKFKRLSKKESIADMPNIEVILNSTTKVPIERYEKGDNARSVECQGVHDLHEPDGCYEYCAFYRPKRD